MLPSFAPQSQDKFYWNREKRFDHSLMRLCPAAMAAHGVEALVPSACTDAFQCVIGPQYRLTFL